ncbi:MAG: hypothetical protein PVJ57_15470 [Phycisphaerae bacterium]|jgi:hypothetical protein
MPRDDTPEQALRAASWQRVRDDFERLASKPFVSLVALVTDGDADPSAFLRELAARENRVHWQGTVIRPVDGQPDEYEPVPDSHRLFGFGEPEAWGAFRAAAMRAGVLAKAVPEHLLSASVRNRIDDPDRWAWALVEIGWRKLDSVPFRAERWVHDDGGAVQLELARATGLYRGWYYSEIGDAVSASIDVVDVLRTMERAANQTPADSPAVRLGAGAAFMRAVEDDPQAQAALKWAQARLRAFAEALKDAEVQRELERSRREQEQAFEALANAIRESVRAAQQDLGDLGFMPPETLDDWEHLARVVEIPFETIKAGDFSSRDVYVMALAWMDRQRMLSQLKRNGDTPQPQAASARTAAGRRAYTVAALRDMTGLGNNALNRYAKTANVTTPRRGERDFKYTLADVRAILGTIIASTAEDGLRNRCKTALLNLPEIAE